jgi:hypothetical protein
MRTEGESSVIITARACLVPLHPTGAGPKPRLGALLSSDDFGSSVERRGGCHPVYGDEWERCLSAGMASAVQVGVVGAAMEVDGLLPTWCRRSAILKFRTKVSDRQVLLGCVS